MTEVFALYAIVLLAAWPLGRYMALVHAPEPGALDRFFAFLERPLYRAMGVRPEVSMDWKQYARALLRLHLLLALAMLLLLMFQHRLPLNPDGVAGMSWDLALHTAASFITNTNQQHYAGQAQLSYLAQLAGVVTLQVVTPAAGLALLLAILRGLFARPGQQALGNFHVDLVRTIVRLLLPLALPLALLLAWQGVPATFAGTRLAAPIDAAAGLAVQHIPVGPVAPLVAIKQLGSNGGGWYGPNAAMPLENPTPLSNLIETVAIVLLPIATVVMAGYLSGRQRLARSILGVMLALSALSTALTVWSENQPNPAFVGLAAPGPNLEGKEVRLGATASALWAGLTTQTSNGSVNGMLDPFNPVGGATALMDMFINVTFGGVGVGLINYLLFLLLAVFLGSLMVGRSPELYGRALEAKEMKLVSVALVLQPLLVLGLTALTVAVPGLAHTSSPGPHGLSQVLYEYASAYANNGSGFEGLGDDTPWWNVSCAAALILGRFIPLLVPLAVAARLAGKRVAPVGAGSLAVETPTFALLTLGVIVLFALLGFLPVLVLGPGMEMLSNGH